MPAKVKEITNIIEMLAPIEYAYNWDNVGLQIGSKSHNVSRILTTLEITDAVLDEAIDKSVDMIITHHPMIFSPLKTITKENMKGNLIYKSIKNNINIYAAHTNIDIAHGGLNDYLVNLLNIKNAKILDITEVESYYKLVVFVPIGYEEAVADAINSAGGGHIGNYSHCTFRVEGMGTFKPLEETNPFIGSHGKLEKVEEIRLETIVSNEKLSKTLDALIKAHPYEEVAYDIYPLENKGPVKGIGRVGKLDETKTLKELVKEIKNRINIEHVKVAGDLNATIKDVAIINGSGADLIQTAINKGFQCVITGDVKYHDAQDAISQGINVIDIGHYDSEKFFSALITDYLKDEIRKRGLDVEVISSTLDINPFKIV